MSDSDSGKEEEEDVVDVDVSVPAKKEKQPKVDDATALSALQAIATSQGLTVKQLLVTLSTVEDEKEKEKKKKKKKKSLAVAASARLMPRPPRSHSASAPQKQSPRSSCSWGGFLILAAIVAVMALVYVPGSFYRRTDGPSYRLLPLTLDHPAKRCIEITKDALATMHASGKWEDISKSMESYLVDGQLDAISAFRVGVPYCYVMTRTSFNTTLHLLNPRIIGRSMESVSRKESSTSCPSRSRWIERAYTVWVQYDGGSLDSAMERSFSGSTSYGVQAEIIFSAGKTICDNSDEGVDTLSHLIRKNMCIEKQ